jgi:hypothetical protein
VAVYVSWPERFEELRILSGRYVSGVRHTDPGRQLFQETAFILRRKANQHHDAVAKQNSDAGLANSDRERDRAKALLPRIPSYSSGLQLAVRVP